MSTGFSGATPTRRGSEAARVLAICAAITGLLALAATALPFLSVEVTDASSGVAGAATTTLGFYTVGVGTFHISWLLPLAAALAVVLGSGQALRGFSAHLTRWLTGLSTFALAVAVTTLIAPPTNTIKGALDVDDLLMGSAGSEQLTDASLTPGSGLVASLILLALTAVAGAAALLVGRRASSEPRASSW